MLGPGNESHLTPTQTKTHAPQALPRPQGVKIPPKGIQARVTTDSNTDRHAIRKKAGPASVCPLAGRQRTAKTTKGQAQNPGGLQN